VSPGNTSQGLLHLSAHRHGVQGDGRLDHLTEGRQARIQSLLPQHKADDLLIELDGMGQERRLGLMGIGQVVEQAVPHEWCVGREVRTPFQLVNG
jgi:hypothetical protein